MQAQKIRQGLIALAVTGRLIGRGNIHVFEQDLTPASQSRPAGVYLFEVG
jgi:hypothetical protein